MKFYLIQPQVAGSLGSGTEFDSPVPPRKITKLDYVFDCWPDQIVKKIMAYAISDDLMSKLQTINVTGATFRPCKVSKGDQFHIASPNQPGPLPVFYQMEPVGEAGKDDIGIKRGTGLIVSERVKNIIRSTNPSDCIIEPSIP